MNIETLKKAMEIASEIFNSDAEMVAHIYEAIQNARREGYDDGYNTCERWGRAQAEEEAIAHGEEILGDDLFGYVDEVADAVASLDSRNPFAAR